ncbi:BF3164 family lipoprotein [Algoriphagus antarcticus]|uniref:TolB-like protein n=1 Tax=Algoriphagus antarcticus TaxID=238540 RepID=A0A3E0DLI2_9BACT|nr:BF3164 family lipoprotein [Algoriphagus antarcticus]REG83532.1 TolB-like protein [Algoriphagus antarcticus]
MNKFILFILLFVLVSCEKEVEVESQRIIKKEDFKEISISSEKHFFEEIINPSGIGLSHDKILISEAWRVPEEHPRMHLVNTSNWTYDKPKGKHGQGPLEITDAAQFLFSPDPDTFWIYNMNRRKLVQFSTTDSTLLGVKDWKLSEPMAMIHFVEIGSDSTYLASPWDGLEKLLEFNREGELIGKYGEWEKIPERPDLELKQVSEMSTGWLDGNPNTGIFVKSSLYRDLITIFDYNEKEFITLSGPNLELPLFDIHETSGPSIFFRPDTKYRYRDVAISSKYIFALYAGRSQIEYNQTGIVAEEILVFDHKGKPLWNLKLDRSIIQIVINEQTNEIYGLTTDEDPGIALFQIPGELL